MKRLGIRVFLVVVLMAALALAGVPAVNALSDGELERMVLEMSLLADEMLGIEGVEPIVRREDSGAISISFPVSDDEFSAAGVGAKSFEMLGIGVSGITPSSITSLITRGVVRSFSEDNLWWTWKNLRNADEVVNTVVSRKCPGGNFTFRDELTYPANRIGLFFIEDVREVGRENVTCTYKAKASGAGTARFKTYVQDP